MDQTYLESYIYEREWYEVTKFVEAGGDVNIVNGGGKSLLHFAVDRGQPDIVRMLLANGADINLQDNDGKTPLHYAVENYIEHRGDDDEAMVKLLVRRGADIYIPDSNNKSPFGIIEEYEDDNGTYELTEWMETKQLKPVALPAAVNLPSQNIPIGSSNSISYENIKEGNSMVNFLNESKQGRYYKKNTYNKIVTNQTIGKKRNPYTRAPIDAITRYKAHMVGGKKRTRKSKKTKKTKKSKKNPQTLK